MHNIKNGDNMQTTVPHIVVERLPEDKRNFDYPDDVKGDLIKEHNWLLSKEGLNIIASYSDLFTNVCEEVDAAVNEGVAVFDGETGIITINSNIL